VGWGEGLQDPLGSTDFLIPKYGLSHAPQSIPTRWQQLPGTKSSSHPTNLILNYDCVLESPKPESRTSGFDLSFSSLQRGLTSSASTLQAISAPNPVVASEPGNAGFVCAPHQCFVQVGIVPRYCSALHPAPWAHSAGSYLHAFTSSDPGGFRLSSQKKLSLLP
jgi:hypothetical protein